MGFRQRPSHCNAMHAVGVQARGYGEKLRAEQCTINCLARYSMSAIGRADAASRCPCRTALQRIASHRIASHRTQHQRGQHPPLSEYVRIFHSIYCTGTATEEQGQLLIYENWSFTTDQ
jgi:hypothetical protein